MKWMGLSIWIKSWAANSNIKSDTDYGVALLLFVEKYPENGLAGRNKVSVEVRRMIAAVWLMLSGLMPIIG